MGRGFEALPDLIEPGEMFGLHQDGAKAGYGFVLFRLRPGTGWEEADGQVGEGQVEIEPGGLVEDVLGQLGRICGGCGFPGPKYDVELWRGDGGDKVWGLGKAAI